MSTQKSPFEIHLLPDTLWPGSVSGARSTELTPIYVERFTGPLTPRATTSHDHWEWIFVLDGQGKFVGDQPSTLAPGCAYLVPPKEAHIEVAPEAIDLVWIGLRGSILQAIVKPEVPRHVHAPMLRNSVLSLWDLTRRPQGSIGLEADGLTRQIYGRFTRTAQGEGVPEVGRIEKILRYLNAVYREDLAMPEVAARFGMSEGHFYREFRRHCGTTPICYLTQIRVRHAVRWLRDTNEPVARIARNTGFRDAHYFSRVIRRLTGQSPSAIRRSLSRRQEEPWT